MARGDRSFHLCVVDSQRATARSNDVPRNCVLHLEKSAFHFCQHASDLVHRRAASTAHAQTTATSRRIFIADCWSSPSQHDVQRPCTWKLRGVRCVRQCVLILITWFDPIVS